MSTTKKINVFKSKPFVKSALKGLGNILSELANNSGGGNVVLYTTYEEGYKTPMYNLSSSICPNDQFRLKHNIEVYNKIKELIDKLPIDQNGDIEFASEFSKYIFINYSYEGGSFNDAIQVSGIYYMIEDEYAKKEIKDNNNNPINCILFRNFIAGAHHLALCENGVVFPYALM